MEIDEWSQACRPEYKYSKEIIISDMLDWIIHNSHKRGNKDAKLEIVNDDADDNPTNL